jgi:hypothetical protein
MRKERRMNPHVEIALAHPVFDPDVQITQRFFWLAERDVSAGLTCNIGME